MQTRTRVIEVLAAICLAACSSGGSSGSTLSGSGAFTVTSAITVLSDGGFAIVGLAAFDPQPTCAEVLDGGNAPASGTGLSLQIFPADGGTIGPGSYEIRANPPPSEGHAYLALFQLDDAGSGRATAFASSGSVNLTSVGTTFVGNFVAQLVNTEYGGDFGQLSGDFSAPVCGP